MPEPTDLQVQLAGVSAQRGAFEQLATTVRASLTAWSKEEADRGFIRSAVLAPNNERWRGRLEQLATSLEQHASTLRGHEANLQQQAIAAVTQSAEAVKAAAAPLLRTKPKARKRSR